MAGYYGDQLKVLARAGIIRPYSPVVLFRTGRTLLDWGPGLAGGFTTLALRAPDEALRVDKLGELTFGELHERTNRLADALRKHGVSPGDGIAIMCRNHRGFVEASVAGAKIGADLLYLNTAFAGPQLADVLEREEPGSSCTTRSSPTSSRPVTTPSGSWPGPTPTTSTARSSSG